MNNTYQISVHSLTGSWRIWNPLSLAIQTILKVDNIKLIFFQQFSDTNCTEVSLFCGPKNMCSKVIFFYVRFPTVINNWKWYNFKYNRFPPKHLRSASMRVTSRYYSRYCSSSSFKIERRIVSWRHRRSALFGLFSENSPYQVFPRVKN